MYKYLVKRVPGISRSNKEPSIIFHNPNDMEVTASYLAKIIAEDFVERLKKGRLSLTDLGINLEMVQQEKEDNG